MLVVGAGVVGLSCAVRLLQAGHRVDVLARDLPRETTSAVAAAIWYPYRAEPRERVGAWGARTYAVLADLDRQGAPGVRLCRTTEVVAATSAEPWWASSVPSLERAPAPAGYAAAWAFTTPVVEMPVYLSWLASRVEELGGTVTRRALGGLPTGGDAVVDAAGLGARLLGRDPSVLPVRGQVVRLAQWGLDRAWLDGSGPTYVVPREHDVVVGGTDEEGQWSRTPWPEVAADVLARAARLVPEVAGARVIAHQVGLRPARPAVRLERDGVDPRVVHCYGHGGSGVTLSWGCAEEVVALVSGPGPDQPGRGEDAST